MERSEVELKAVAYLNRQRLRNIDNAVDTVMSAKAARRLGNISLAMYYLNTAALYRRNVETYNNLISGRSLCTAHTWVWQCDCEVPW